MDFANKLMGRVLFLYFLQKEGRLGMAKGRDPGAGPHDFLQRLVNQSSPSGSSDSFNIFDNVLELLCYATLATDRGHGPWCNRFK